MKKYPLLYLILGTFGALGVALLIVIIGIKPPDEDLQLLILFMLSSGLGTIGAVYLLYQRLLTMWVNSLRWSLIVTVITTVTLVFLNVWGTAQLMFINQHDLILTSALLVFGGLTAVVFGWFVASRIAHKIQEISDGIEDLAQGNLDVRIPVTGQDELSKLAGMVNWMVASLQEIEAEKAHVSRARRDLVTWISHDLRTPLTTIQASLEAIADDIVTEPGAIKEYVGHSLVEVENLKVLIEDLFAISQLDSGHMSLEFIEASLSDLISDTVSSMRVRAGQREINITGEIGEGIDPIYMAPEKIQRVLYNLIDNAIRHTPKSGSIVISAARSEEGVRVNVRNSGDPIDPEHLPRLFEKFYRGEAARAKDPDGHRGAGLGLAIARGFIEAHQGKIWAENHADLGPSFSFILPHSHTLPDQPSPS